MALELYTRTNQKIYFAGLALEAWTKAEVTKVANVQAVAQSGREASLFHLYGALLGLCHEIAGYYGLPEASAPRVELFLTSDVLEAAPSPELAELVELAQHSHTWLAQLLEAYQALFQPLRAPKKAKIDPTLALISSVSLDEEEAPLSAAKLEEWRQNLKLLALRFRETLTEY